MNTSRLAGSRRKPASIRLRALYSARSVRADRPLMPGVCWYTRKVSQDGVRVLGVEVVVRHLEHAAAVEEVRVDRAHRRLLGAVDALLDVQHQDLVELRHRLGGPVVAVHQHLGRALAAVGGLVAEALGHGGLQVEHQPVLAPPGDQVQPRADQLQRAFVACCSWLTSKGVIRPLAASSVQLRAEAGGTRHPDHQLQVAQAARAFLAVGLERVGRVLVLRRGAGASPASWRAGRPSGPSPRRWRWRKAANTRRDPHRKRDSSSAVCTVTSRRAWSTHSSTVRTREPISRPMSQQACMKPSIAVRSGSARVAVASPRAASSAWPAGSSTSTSTSECGNSSPRPIAADGHQRGAGRHARHAPRSSISVRVDMPGQRLWSSRRRGQRGGARLAEVLEQRGLAVAEALRAARPRCACRVRLARQHDLGQRPTCVSRRRRPAAAGLPADRSAPRSRSR